MAVIRMVTLRDLTRRDLVVAGVAMAMLLAREQADERVQQAAASTIIQIALLAVSVAAAVYAAARKSRTPLQDSNPSTASLRGSQVTFLIGRHRVAPVILYVGDRTRDLDFGAALGKRGGGGGVGKTYSEVGWHAICIGPAHSLRRIWSGGALIFDSFITPRSHPSGTTIQAGAEGSFRIYWGERDQPIDARLGDLIKRQIGASFDIASRWHSVMSIVWDKRNLTNFPQWQIHEYEVDVAPISELAGSGGVIAESIIDAPANPVEGVEGFQGAFNVFPPTPKEIRLLSKYGDQRSRFSAGRVVRVWGGAATTYYGTTPAYPEVVSTAFNPAAGWTTVLLSDQQTVQVVSNKNTPGAGPLNIAPCIYNQIGTGPGGPNLVSCLWQLLFAPWPWGRSLPREEFHMPSFERAAQIAAQEGLVGSVMATEGQTALQKVSELLQDLGAFLAYDANIGKTTLRMIRAPEGAVPSIPAEMVLPPRAALERLHGPQRDATRTVYSFADARHNYKPMTIVIGSDGGARYGEVQRAETVEIASTVDYATAATIATRRSQEDVGKAALSIKAGRDAALLVPGDPFKVEGENHALRLVSVKPELLTSQQELKARIDNYAVATIDSQRLPSDVGSTPPSVGPQADLMVAVVELPRYRSDGTMAIAIARVRAIPQVVGAHVWISIDGESYKHVGTVRGAQTGGTLVDALPASSPTLIESDVMPVAIAPIGPDQDVADAWQDLSGNDAAWRLGQQVALIGDEIVFVRAVTANMDGSLTLEGVLRARYATGKHSHASDAPIIVARSDQLAIIRDVLLQPGVTLSVKCQPFTATQAVDLAEIIPVEVQLTGKAFTPLPPLNLRTANHRGIYRSGDPVELRWSYRTAHPLTGAGMFGYGNPSGNSPPVGEFVLRFYEVGSPLVLKRTVIIEDGSTSFIYPNAELVSDFGGEPASLLVTLENVDAGFRSPAISLTVERA